MCAEFGRAWRLSYTDRLLTSKGHVAEVHVPHFIDDYAICGVFEEDGAEAKHQQDSAVRLTVRSMQNPGAGLGARALRLAARCFTPDLARLVHTRQSAKKNVAAAQMAQAIAAAPPWGALGGDGGGDAGGGGGVLLAAPPSPLT